MPPHEPPRGADLPPTGEEHPATDHASHGTRPRIYLKLAAMVLTGMAVMYAAMFAGSWVWSDVRPSESRLFMALVMGGAMGLVMLAWMAGMYRSRKANAAVIAVSLVMLVAGVALDRSQVTVDDTAYMNSMIPHHSLAITRSEHARLADLRVCRLAASISETQRREIDEMDWLIDDIQRNGVASTVDDARSRAVPDFPASAERTC